MKKILNIFGKRKSRKLITAKCKLVVYVVINVVNVYVAVDISKCNAK